MTVLGYSKNSIGTRFLIRVIDKVIEVCEKKGTTMSNPSTAMTFTLLAMTKENLERDMRELRVRDLGPPPVREKRRVGVRGEGFLGRDVRGVVREYEQDSKAQRVFLEKKKEKTWRVGRSRDFVLDFEPLVRVFEEGGFGPRISTCGEDSAECLRRVLSDIVEGAMQWDARCSTIQKSELGVKIHVQWKRSRETKQCPFYFGKERVFLLVCVERCLRDAGERWPGDGEKVWCCWLGERIKIGCLGLGWGMDFRGKDVDEEKSGRWDNEKNWEGVEDELRPLLLE